MSETNKNTAGDPASPAGDIPIFDADGALSRAFLLNRGYCCGNGCRNCPYDYAAVPARRSAEALRAARRAGASAGSGTIS